MRPREDELLVRAVARLRARVLALVIGLLSGTGLFVATAWLLVRGGEPIGPHLGLLAQYFPGYSVTWPGAAIGFVWAGLAGAAAGAAVAWIYNLLVLRWDRR